MIAPPPRLGRAISVLLAIASGAALGAGCTLLHAPSDHSDPIETTELCPELARISCDARERCCPPDAITHQQCVDLTETYCARAYGTLASDPRTGYDALQAARALHELEARAASCSLDLIEWYNGREGLRSLLTGTIPGGESCTPRPIGMELDIPAWYACAEPSQTCAIAVGGFLCQAPTAAGGPCYLTPECTDGLFCTYDGSTGSTPGRCEARRPDGTPCTSDDQCASLICSMAAGTCVERTTPRVYCGAE